MRYAKWLFVVLAALLCVPTLQARRMRLMTYNIRHGEGTDRMYAPERIAKMILAEAPEVVALQEVDSATQRIKGRYVAGDIAQHTGMHATYAGAIPFQGGKYGIALLSKSAPKAVTRIPLPGREEKRVLLVADFGAYVVCCTHLSLTEEDRINSIPALRKVLRKYRHKKVFVMGDFNDSPGSAFMNELGKHFQILSSTITPTFPNDKPTEVIDFVITRRGTNQPRATGMHITVGSVASDHCPLTVDVEM